MEKRIIVFDENNNPVGRVRYNNNLDYWDGRNWSNGGVGKHKGLTKLRNGEYVLILGSDWQGDRDYAILISPTQALKEVLQSGNINLLKTKKFKDLKVLYEVLYDTKLENEDEENFEME